ncbi:MAG TPA: methyltransferase domain-containing protein [Dongiaceae bacterium]|nr:methyltransferase domain-containing protein [Dongiaceae bacterium]
MLDMMDDLAAGQDPDPIYRARFIERLLALAPRSVLDVGCGTGTLLTSLSGKVAELHGVDTDPARVEVARAAGLDVQRGDAYALPFGAQSIDLVTFQHVPHHLADWPRALAEALRVARRGVLVLEGWYDRSIASQDTAAELEAWSKAIDRATGMVHEECPSAGQLVASLPAAKYQVEHQQHLVLRLRAIEDVAQENEAQLAKLPSPGAAGETLRRHLAAARKTGVSYEGALILSVLTP